MHTIREVNYEEWNAYFKSCRQVNMLQHWQYAAAKERDGKFKAVRFLVVDEVEQVVALVQFLTKTFPFIGGVARMNRGPLLVGDIHCMDRVKVVSEVMSAIRNEARKRKWWMIQVAPELQESEAASQALLKLGFRQLPIEPWASGVFSLVQSEEKLMARLKAKWRNCLRKGLRLGVSVENSEESNSDVDLLLKHYQKLQKDKGFSGISDSLIFELSCKNCDDWQFTIFIASEAGKDNNKTPIGMLVTIHHGDTSTYFMGSTNDRGRKCQANYVLLWQAILHAKKTGCKWFDIGGLNNTTPKGIAHFKNGLNAEMYNLVGEWRGFSTPW